MFKKILLERVYQHKLLLVSEEFACSLPCRLGHIPDLHRTSSHTGLRDASTQSPCLSTMIPLTLHPSLQ